MSQPTNKPRNEELKKWQKENEMKNIKSLEMERKEKLNVNYICFIALKSIQIENWTNSIQILFCLYFFLSIVGFFFLSLFLLAFVLFECHWCSFVLWMALGNVSFHSTGEVNDSAKCVFVNSTVLRINTQKNDRPKTIFWIVGFFFSLLSFILFRQQIFGC